MKRLIFAAVSAAILFASCEKEGNNKAVIHLQMDYEFDVDNNLFPVATTSFEYLDVKAKYSAGTVQGTENVTAKTWKKDVSITDFPCTVEFTSEFSLKPEYDSDETLPEKLNANFAAPHEGKVKEAGTAWKVTVDYYSNSTLIKSEEFSCGYQVSIRTNFKSAEAGLEKTRKFLSNRSLYGFKATVK